MNWQKQEIIEVLHQLFICTDDKDWASVEACFTEVVHFDMTSLGAGEPQKLTPKEITAAWDEGLKNIEQLHHQVGNFLISAEGNTATAFCYGTATHYDSQADGEKTRTFVGSYNFELVKEGTWKISAFKYNSKFITGNLDLGS